MHYTGVPVTVTTDRIPRGLSGAQGWRPRPNPTGPQSQILGPFSVLREVRKDKAGSQRCGKGWDPARPPLSTAGRREDGEWGGSRAGVSTGDESSYTHWYSLGFVVPREQH